MSSELFSVMVSCDMCGSSPAPHQIKLEGSLMTVCKHCTEYGKVMVPIHLKKSKPKLFEESSTKLVPDYASIIRSARQKRNLSQQQLAKALAEKDSVISHIESSAARPSEKLARKLERFLNIKLYESIESESLIPKTSKSTGLTIGDLLKK